MSYLVVCTAALLVSALTLFSGFGLGTLLMPAFALFFPLEVAVAATAVVHLANNLFKAALVGRHAEWSVLLRFALPAIPAAFVGAWLLTTMGECAPLATYAMAGRVFEVTALKLMIAVVMAGFAVLELWTRFESLAFEKRWLPLGGVISGFFGGLSGHQGALRSAFLMRAGLTKEQFIGTGVCAAVLVDLARLGVYGRDFAAEKFSAVEQPGWPLVAAACIAAFTGTYVGSRLVAKVTMRTVRVVVGVLLLVIAAALGAGVI